METVSVYPKSREAVGQDLKTLWPVLPKSAVTPIMLKIITIEDFTYAYDYPTTGDDETV